MTSSRARCRLFAVAIVVALSPAVHAGRVLFDATKSEMAGNADWVIDSDNEVGGDSNPARFPTPAQSGITASTPESFWKGGISAWGVTMVKHANTVESLPRTGAITYGNTANAQDLTHYKTFVVCEPNNAFSLMEKQALLNFVVNGGGLFMVSDHNNADRDGDGIDAAGVWNDFFTNNGTASNPFGMSVNLNSISQVSTNVAAGSALTTGVAGTATSLEFNAGATLTISTAANSSVKSAVYTNGSTNNANVMMAYATYGLGRVVLLGDSSPADDGTGDTGDTLFTGWATGTNGTLISNATDWVNSSLASTYDAPTGGSFANASAWTGAVPEGADFFADLKNYLAADSTITLDKDRTIGRLRFDATKRYTISGTNTLTFIGATVAGNGLIVVSGSHTINVPISAGKAAKIDVQQAGSVLTVGRITTASNYDWTKLGNGGVVFTRLDSTNTLTISAGSMRLINATPATIASDVRTLSITSGASLDLGAGAFVINYGASSPLATIKTYLADGRLKTTTNGLTVGYAEASALAVTEFAGATVDGTSLLLRSTLGGDANLDLAVNFDDLVRLAQHYNLAGEWSDGDFDRSGTIEFADLVSLAQNYGGTAGVIKGAPPSLASDWALAQSLVPEPTIMLALLPLLARRGERRRRI